jgi:hypothetical protein
MINDPNEQSSPSLWKRIWTWLAGENVEGSPTPKLLLQTEEKKPEIVLSPVQKAELDQAMDMPVANDTNFLPSDTSLRRKEAAAAAASAKKVII